MGDDRTETARDHDDHELIEGMVTEPGAEATGREGNLAGITGSRDDLKAVDDPDGHTRATKQDDIDAGVAERSNRTAGG